MKKCKCGKTKSTIWVNDMCSECHDEYNKKVEVMLSVQDLSEKIGWEITDIIELSKHKELSMPTYSLKNIEARNPIPGFALKFIHGENMTSAHWQIEKDSALLEHSHRPDLPLPGRRC